ncbi:hypothetical protein BV900_14895 [Agrobacterium tumefaciens]|nr:hypothetical protein BV900_14895 [Agrobacterium tumefaciens]
MTSSIYLDGHSTTPLAPEALEAMTPWWHTRAANPHSPHLRGMLAAEAVERARSELGSLLSADPQELTFTSGATEANNIAIRGSALAARAAGSARNRIVVSAIEHKSVLAAAASLTRDGFEVLQAPVTSDGVIDLGALQGLVDTNTLLVAVMAVNNEVGSLQPLEKIVEICRSTGTLLHVDIAQAAAKIEIDVSAFDFASVSSHKLYGPMGIGALFVSAAASVRPQPLIVGGGQEHGLRPGTIPTPLIVGFGEAARIARPLTVKDQLQARDLSEVFLTELRNRQVRFSENIPAEKRVPGSLSLHFPGVEAMSLINRLGERVALSEGSACNSGQIDFSHVLRAMNYSLEKASETVRIFISRYNTRDEMVVAAELIANAAY